MGVAVNVSVGVWVAVAVRVAVGVVVGVGARWSPKSTKMTRSTGRATCIWLGVVER